MPSRRNAFLISSLQHLAVKLNDVTKFAMRLRSQDHLIEDGMANTTKITDKLERKKLKRKARKEAPAKAARTGARGALKKKVKKLRKGQTRKR